MINKIIIGEENWRLEYLKPANRKKIWIYIKLSNKNIVFLPEYSLWLDFEKYLIKHKLKIIQIGLRHKTNIVKYECDYCEYIYLIKSLKGQFGGSTKNCYTIGLIENGKVKKIMLMTPELIEEDSYYDNIENCFKEAIINNKHG